MIDSLTKNLLDPLWEKAAQPLIRLGATPNQVTLAGLVLIVLSALGYLWHQSETLFGLSLALAFAFDALDGAVARARGMQSRAGGYLDGVVDRYQELVVLAVLAHVNDLWALALAGFSGAVLTSYAKARTALEIRVSNEGWPDLFERLERIVFLCALLIGAGIAGAFDIGAAPVLGWGLALYALLAHISALQRARRAWQMLRAHDAAQANTGGADAH